MLARRHCRVQLLSRSEKYGRCSSIMRKSATLLL
jgi:hypothetical protein